MLISTVSDYSRLFHDLSDMGRHGFSYRGAYALMEYLSELSDDIGEDIAYDPIAFDCEYVEYADFEEFVAEHSHSTNRHYRTIGRIRVPLAAPIVEFVPCEYESLEDLCDDHRVIMVDGSGFIVEAF